MPDGAGTVGLIVTNFGSKLKSSMTTDQKVKMEIELTGIGHIGENHTNFDLTENKNLILVQNTINSKTSEHVLEMITKVQKEFGTDVFGFNQTFNRQHPLQWKKVKEQWDTIFPNIEIKVNVNINVKYVGLVGPPLHLKESEIVK
ncbi:Spore germination protein A3 precursor [compost metagenome]